MKYLSSIHCYTSIKLITYARLYNICKINRDRQPIIYIFYKPMSVISDIFFYIHIRDMNYDQLNKDKLYLFNFNSSE